jgi:hypothetical protein
VRDQVGVGGESGQAPADDDTAKGQREPRSKVRTLTIRVMAASSHGSATDISMIAAIYAAGMVLPIAVGRHDAGCHIDLDAATYRAVFD